nr:MAG TPA: hypothetical protein [Bacteriophage sp.]
MGRPQEQGNSKLRAYPHSGTQLCSTQVGKIILGDMRIGYVQTR